MTLNLRTAWKGGDGVTDEVRDFDDDLPSHGYIDDGYGTCERCGFGRWAWQHLPEPRTMSGQPLSPEQRRLYDMLGGNLTLPTIHAKRRRRRLAGLSRFLKWPRRLIGGSF